MKYSMCDGWLTCLCHSWWVVRWLHYGRTDHWKTIISWLWSYPWTDINHFMSEIWFLLFLLNWLSTEADVFSPLIQHWFPETAPGIAESNQSMMLFYHVLTVYCEVSHLITILGSQFSLMIYWTASIHVYCAPVLEFCRSAEIYRPVCTVHLNILLLHDNCNLFYKDTEVKTKSKHGYSSSWESSHHCSGKPHAICDHTAAVTFPPLPQPKLVLNLATQEGCKVELTWVVVTSQDSLPAKDSYLSQK